MILIGRFLHVFPHRQPHTTKATHTSDLFITAASAESTEVQRVRGTDKFSQITERNGFESHNRLLSISVLWEPLFYIVLD